MINQEEEKQSEKEQMLLDQLSKFASNAEVKEMSIPSQINPIDQKQQESIQQPLISMLLNLAEQELRPELTKVSTEEEKRDVLEKIAKVRGRNKFYVENALNAWNNLSKFYQLDDVSSMMQKFVQMRDVEQWPNRMRETWEAISSIIPKENQALYTSQVADLFMYKNVTENDMIAYLTALAQEYKTQETDELVNSKHVQTTSMRSDHPTTLPSVSPYGSSEDEKEKIVKNQAKPFIIPKKIDPLWKTFSTISMDNVKASLPSSHLVVHSKVLHLLPQDQIVVK